MKVKNILISQNAPADFSKSPYAELTKKYSVNIEFFKFFKVEGISTREFRDSKIRIPDYEAVVFSSRNAIDYFFNLVKDLRVEISEEMKYFCPNDQIAFYLQKYIQFRKRKIFYPKNNTQKGLFELFLKNPELKYLIPSGADATANPNVEFMREHNITCQEAVIFRTIPAEIKDSLDITKFDLLVFFSPFGIQSLKYNFPEFEQGEVAIGALGDAAAEAVEAAGLTLHVKAPTPKFPSITAALDAFLKEYATRRR